MMRFPDQDAIIATAEGVVKEPPDGPLGSAAAAVDVGADDGTRNVATV